MRKAATEIEEGVAVLEAREDEGVGFGTREAEVKKAELADTWEWLDVPSTIADSDDVWNDFLGRNVAVVFEQVSLGFSYGF